MRDDRPTCLNCIRALSPDEQQRQRLVCIPCEDRTRDNLLSLAGRTGLYAALVRQGVDALTPLSARRRDGSSGTKAGSSAPARMDTLNLTGSGGVVTTLQRWVELWYGELNFDIPRWKRSTVWSVSSDPATGKKINVPGRIDQAVKCLDNNLPWAVEQFYNFRTFSLSVKKMVDDCKSALDPGGSIISILIGRCPVMLEDEAACGAKLYVNPYKQAIRCFGCGTEWRRDQWVDLGAALTSGWPGIAPGATA